MTKPVSKIQVAKIELYRKKGKIHAKSVSGRYNTLRWAAVWLTQMVFYGAAWLQFDPGSGVRQAILFDIGARKFHLFGLTLWPQDALLLAIALILAATALFLVSALAGRLFCGFVCPQTVYTMLFTWIEAKVEGDHLARLKLDQAPLGAGKLAKRVAKHAAWLLLAGWTGFTFVGYFTPIRELAGDLATWNVSGWSAFWVFFYSAFTYVQAGFAREAVCQHMCPYSRFQGVMFDRATRTVSYDAGRGEPRGKAAPGKPAGDCIDCGLCVQVCPTGIDIRDGLQYQCIDCGLCADACNEVMTKLARPVGLIRFASEQELAGTPRAGQRARLAAYAGLLLAFIALGAWTLNKRTPLLVDVLRDRGSLARVLADGRIENSYTLKLMNLVEAPRDFEVEVSGMPGMDIVGAKEFAAPAGSVRAVQVTVSAPASDAPAIRTIAFQITSRQDPSARVIENSTFILP